MAEGPVYKRRRRLMDVAILVGVLLTAWRLFSVDGQPALPPQGIGIGSVLDLNAVDIDLSRPAVVLAVRSTCAACEASVNLYRRLLATVEATQRDLVLLSSDSSSVLDAWLRGHGIRVSYSVASVNLRAMGFKATPTLALIDATGTVTDLLVGRLDRTVEAQLEERLSSLSDEHMAVNAKVVEQISLRSFVTEWVTANAVLVDVRRRDAYRGGHRDDAINIPYDEIKSRAPAELRVSDPVVVDCTGDRFSMCEIAAESLLQVGADRVAILTPGGDVR